MTPTQAVPPALVDGVRGDPAAAQNGDCNAVQTGAEADQKEEEENKEARTDEGEGRNTLSSSREQESGGNMPASAPVKLSVAADPQQEMEEFPSLPVLAAVWKRVSTADGRPYYWNAVTNETSWTKPEVDMLVQ